MKVAIVGKGGSGKSTASWLLANYLATKNDYVLAIDADHNMDLAGNFGISVDDSTPYFYKANSEIRELANMPAVGKWTDYYLTKKPLKLQLNPSSDILKKYFVNIKPNLDLLILGLGSENIMYGDKCSHGLSSHLKYLLPTIQTNAQDFVVLDSVAGADMLNYGLYFGVDVVCCVVESHVNSIKVAKQLYELANEQGLNFKFILNKYDPENNLIQEFLKKYNGDVVGEILPDNNLSNLKYSTVNKDTEKALENLVINLLGLPTISDEQKLINLKNFETKKQEFSEQLT